MDMVVRHLCILAHIFPDVWKGDAWQQAVVYFSADEKFLPKPMTTDFERSMSFERVKTTLKRKARTALNETARLKRRGAQTAAAVSAASAEREGSIHVSNLQLKSRFEASKKRPKPAAKA